MFCKNKINSLDFLILCKDKCEIYKSNNSIKVTTKKVLCNNYIANKK